ncbi:MAG: DUF4167 domain-containing protein [Sphingomonadaceae bacterium]
MNSRQSGRRRRGGGNAPRPMGQAMGGQGGNRLEVRVRGNAHQLLEKYKQLARDAHQAGDRVASEYYLQHADHYFRVLNDSRIRQEEMRARRGIFDPLDDETEDEEMMEGPDRRNGEEAELRDAAPSGSGQEERREERRERPGRRFERRDTRASDAGAAPDEAMTDGDHQPAAEAPDAAGDSPRPRRRGRPRRTEPAPVEG